MRPGDFYRDRRTSCQSGSLLFTHRQIASTFLHPGDSESSQCSLPPSCPFHLLTESPPAKLSYQAHTNTHILPELYGTDKMETLADFEIIIEILCVSTIHAYELLITAESSLSGDEISVKPCVQSSNNTSSAPRGPQM